MLKVERIRSDMRVLRGGSPEIQKTGNPNSFVSLFDGREQVERSFEEES